MKKETFHTPELKMEKLTLKGKIVSAVFFHKPEEPNGFLGNWFPSEFELDGMRFTSNEQYIMYRKCMIMGDRKTAERVLATDTPEEQQKLAKGAVGYNDTVWRGMRQSVAARGLYAKFTQNEALKEALLATGEAFLVECAFTDRVWACGWHLWDEGRLDIDKWRGENILGFALMEIRDVIRRKEGIMLHE